MTILINKVGRSKVCRDKVVIVNTKLNNVTIETDLKERVDTFPKDMKIKVFYKNKEMKLKKTFKGGNGKVCLYYLDNFSVAVKIPFSDIYEEIDIVEKYLKKVKVEHYIIPYRVVYHKGNPFLITQEANGNLEDINWDKEDNKIKRQTILFIYKAMKFFYENKLIYTDLKLENILYKCEDNGISLFFADLGSFEKTGSKYGVYTYAPLETYKSGFKNNINIMKYLLGIVICQVYDIKIDKYFYFDYVVKGAKDKKTKEYNYSLVKENFISQYDKFVKKYPDLDDWIYKLLSCDVKIRKNISMEEIHKKIKKL